MLVLPGTDSINNIAQNCWFLTIYIYTDLTIICTATENYGKLATVN